jgi:DME family drug/metabolite transporter
VLMVALLVLRRVGELVDLARARPRQLLAVGVGTAAYQGFYFVSVTQVGVAVSTVVSLGLAPVLLTVAESVRHRRTPTRSRLAVLAAALTGLVLVSVAGHESATGPAPLAGVLLAVASGTTYALTTVAGGSISRQASPLVLTSGMTLVGAVTLGLCLALVDGPLVTDDPAAVAWLVYLGALTMALAYVLLYSGLRVVAPSTAVTASLVEPVTAAVVAAVVLSEALGPAAVVGILLVLGAVAGLGRASTAAGPVLPDAGAP